MNHTPARCNFQAAFRVTVRAYLRDLDLTFRETLSRSIVRHGVSRAPAVLLAPTFDRGFVRMSFHQKVRALACSFRNHRAQSARTGIRARARSRIPLFETRSPSRNANQSADPATAVMAHSSRGVSPCAPRHADNTLAPALPRAYDGVRGNRAKRLASWLAGWR